MSEQIAKHDHILMALTLNLQSIAMVQLGKVTSPASGEIERDLDGARGTIDILEMLKVKCRHETPPPVLRLLDQTVMDLQMNYLDEVKHEAAKAKAEQPAAAAPAQADAAAAADAAPESAEDGKA